MLPTRHPAVTGVRANVAAHFALLAGRAQARRDYWLIEARAGDPELKSMRAGFARCAHHEYLRHVRRIRRAPWAP